MIGTIRRNRDGKLNNAGAKQLLKKALRDGMRVVMDADPKKRNRAQIILDNMLDIASGMYGPEAAVTAFNAIAKASGLYEDAGETKTITVTRVTFEPRADGDLALPETVLTIEQMHKDLERPEGEATVQ